MMNHWYMFVKVSQSQLEHAGHHSCLGPGLLPHSKLQTLMEPVSSSGHWRHSILFGHDFGKLRIVKFPIAIQISLLHECIEFLLGQSLTKSARDREDLLGLNES